jgi:hypothetical protein
MSMNWHDAAIAIAIFGMSWGVIGLTRGAIVRWRDEQRQRVLFTFRSLESMGVNEAGGGNAWGGVLTTDRVITAEQGEILRAAVERYRGRCSLLPIDGQVFELKNGELVKL